ncbi:MAG: hypothetical protein SPI19_02830 [Peptoniphilaceae bacterium]|nr:hypothetical protein [Peptoniphilaceae bacterium]
MDGTPWSALLFIETAHVEIYWILWGMFLYQIFNRENDEQDLILLRRQSFLRAFCLDFIRNAIVILFYILCSMLMATIIPALFLRMNWAPSDPAAIELSTNVMDQLIGPYANTMSASLGALLTQALYFLVLTFIGTALRHILSKQQAVFCMAFILIYEQMMVVVATKPWMQALVPLTIMQWDLLFLSGSPAFPMSVLFVVALCALLFFLVVRSFGRPFAWQRRPLRILQPIRPLLSARFIVGMVVAQLVCVTLLTNVFDAGKKEYVLMLFGGLDHPDILSVIIHAVLNVIPAVMLASQIFPEMSAVFNVELHRYHSTREWIRRIGICAVVFVVLWVALFCIVSVLAGQILISGEDWRYFALDSPVGQAYDASSYAALFAEGAGIMLMQNLGAVGVLFLLFTVTRRGLVSAMGLILSFFLLAMFGLHPSRWGGLLTTAELPRGGMVRLLYAAINGILFAFAFAVLWRRRRKTYLS